jgi:PPK2 family polyphosphate:nucleotide phosphotransferase
MLRPDPDLETRLRLEPGSEVDLDRIDARSTPGFAGRKDDSDEPAAQLNAELEELQERLWACRRERLLVVLQGMDTSGKDGVIRKVFDGVNPLGVRVASFKKPTEEELAHDFLWRVHREVPAAGEIVIFNRSHYEDVLVVRVQELVPESIWRPRYEQIVDFERLLTESGTTVVKFYLHISRDEQRERLEARLADPDKQWKFDSGDLLQREKWSSYRRAYEEALFRTSTRRAPWYIVPADRKWYRNLAISQILVETLRQLDLELPRLAIDPEKIRIVCRPAASSRTSPNRTAAHRLDRSVRSRAESARRVRDRRDGGGTAAARGRTRPRRGPPGSR